MRRGGECEESVRRGVECEEGRECVEGSVRRVDKRSVRRERSVRRGGECEEGRGV